MMDDKHDADELQAKIKAWNEERFAKAPEYVRVLGDILRKSMRSGGLLPLRRFLFKHGLWNNAFRNQLEVLRDYLIITRPDLKEFESAARERLRERTLVQENHDLETADYRIAMQKGEEIYCRDCAWFVHATGSEDPDDPDPSKTCVEMGAKGSDQACVGFKRFN